MDRDFLEYLRSFLSENKRNLFDTLIENRTRYGTVVLEDLYQPHNSSAVLRTCECFGIQDVHIIENRNIWEYSPDVERGSSKWLSLTRYKSSKTNTAECLDTLEGAGYKIVATSPYADTDIDDLNVNHKLAFVFGNEKKGVSEEVLNRAHEKIRIPMYGFTESFNISVAAAICMHTYRRKLKENHIDWNLSPEEKDLIMMEWCKKALKHFDDYYLAYRDKRKR